MPEQAQATPSLVGSEVLFRRHARFVASFLARIGARGADLDDAMQEVFLSAHKRGGFRPGAASETTFLARIALEVNLARRRSAGRRLRDFDLANAEGAVGHGPLAPDDALANKSAALRFERVLQQMDEGQRSVFILFELEGESCATIAAGLELPLGTVYSRLHLARRAFRDAVQRSAGRVDSADRRPR